MKCPQKWQEQAAAAKREDPFTEMHNKKMRELKDKMLSPAAKQIKRDLEYMAAHPGQRRPIGETITQAPAYMSIKTTRPDEQTLDVKKRIDERAHKQIAAEKKARTEEAPKAVLKATQDLAATAIGGAVGGPLGAFIGFAISKGSEIADAKAHDEGKMSLTEQTIYHDNLYEHARFGAGMSLQGVDDFAFDQAHQTTIDQRKEAIKAEEDENK